MSKYSYPTHSTKRVQGCLGLFHAVNITGAIAPKGGSLCSLTIHRRSTPPPPKRERLFAPLRKVRLKLTLYLYSLQRESIEAIATPTLPISDRNDRLYQVYTLDRINRSYRTHRTRRPHRNDKSLRDYGNDGSCVIYKLNKTYIFYAIHKTYIIYIIYKDYKYDRLYRNI